MKTTLDNFSNELEILCKKYNYVVTDVEERLVNDTSPIYDFGKAEPMGIVGCTRHILLTVKAMRLT